MTNDKKIYYGLLGLLGVVSVATACIWAVYFIQKPNSSCTNVGKNGEIRLMRDQEDFSAPYFLCDVESDKLTCEYTYESGRRPSYKNCASKTGSDLGVWDCPKEIKRYASKCSKWKK
ncbi:MAG: hypothetical protein LBE13_22310 [Bacteroidales bacterium]|jgi:hypothetical protein|nr:hypothetical protein [Bacteroidales bacterium]